MADGVYLQNNRRVLRIPGKQVYELVEMLAGAGFVKDVETDRSHTLSPAQTDAYAPEIADYFCDSAAARFEAFRHTRVVAVGAGQTLTALVAANLVGHELGYHPRSLTHAELNPHPHP